MEDMTALELIFAVAGPAALILFLLGMGWAAIERGSVHAYVRQRWRCRGTATGRGWLSMVDEKLRPARPHGTRTKHHFKEHSGWRSQR